MRTSWCVRWPVCVESPVAPLFYTACPSLMAIACVCAGVCFVCCVQVSMSQSAELDVLLQCRVYFHTAEYSRALHVMESRNLCSSAAPQHLPFRALTAQCLVCSVCVALIISTRSRLPCMAELLPFVGRCFHTVLSCLSVVSILIVPPRCDLQYCLLPF